MPAAVYINGEYAGFYWVKEPFSAGQMEELQGAAEGSFERVTLQEFYKTAGEEGEEKNRSIEDYQEIYDTYAEADLTDDTVFAELCSRIDLENYLAYYALEIYIANKDWPYNNVRAYRYSLRTEPTPKTRFSTADTAICSMIRITVSGSRTMSPAMHAKKIILPYC